MRKTWIFVISASFLTCALFVTIYFYATHRTNPSRGSTLNIEFNPAPPWLIRPGQNFTLNMSIKNEGKNSAKNVNINFTAPTGFLISESGTNYYIISFAELKGGEIKNQTLTLTIPTIIAPGNYNVTVTFYAERVPIKSNNYQITVELPHVPN
jgi:uncharacterized membrane protein